MIVVVPLILCCVIFIVWWWWFSPRGLEPPVYPGRWLFVGHAHLFWNNLLKFWEEEKKMYHYALKNGGIIQGQLGTHVVYILTDPDECLHVANTCLDKTYIYRFGKEVYGSGLVTAELSSWKSHRKLLNPAFNPKVLNSFINEFNDLGKRIVSKLSSEVGKGPVDILDELMQNTLKAVFNKFRPLLDQILDLGDQKQAFTDDEIIDHLGTMVVAAYNTTDVSLNFVLALVGSYPKVQQRIFEELKVNIGDGDRNIDKDDLAKLIYLEAVVKETLRLYPPGPRIARTRKSNLKIRNYTLKANSTIILSLYAINRHPMWGADADQFRPERWLDPASLPDNPNAFASFSLGRRNCLGKSYAMLVIKLTLAYILRKYHVTADVKKLQCRAELVLKPVDGHQVAFELRK